MQPVIAPARSSCHSLASRPSAPLLFHPAPAAEGEEEELEQEEGGNGDDGHPGGDDEDWAFTKLLAEGVGPLGGMVGAGGEQEEEEEGVDDLGGEGVGPMEWTAQGLL
jgi:hypothetical protein